MISLAALYCYFWKGLKGASIPSFRNVVVDQGSNISVRGETHCNFI